MKIVFLGTILLPMLKALEPALSDAHQITYLPDVPKSDEQIQMFKEAEVIVGSGLDKSWPRPQNLKMFQLMGAGWDGIDTSLLPEGCYLCNCYGHEIPIAEFVISSILHFQIPLVDAHKRMLKGDWFYMRGDSLAVHKEAYGTTLGILGYGHIGQATAIRARALGMHVAVANRSDKSNDPSVDSCYSIKELETFATSVDFLLVALELNEETRNIVDRDLLHHMKEDAVLINVGRGGLVHEADLYEALSNTKIRGAVLDALFNYPSADDPNPLPVNLDFGSLDNVYLTSHMSGLTMGTIERRVDFVTMNMTKITNDEVPENIVWQGK